MRSELTRALEQESSVPHPTIVSDYYIAVHHKKNGAVVQYAPGLTVEKELVNELVTRVQAKGVGVLRTEAHVLVDVRAAMMEMLRDLKSLV